MSPSAGGLPFIIGQELVAALGVSGGTIDQDSEIAGAAMRNLSELTKKEVTVEG